jgi:hypothetical protein
MYSSLHSSESDLAFRAGWRHGKHPGYTLRPLHPCEPDGRIGTREDRLQESTRGSLPHGAQSQEKVIDAVELTLDSFADPVYCRIVMIDGPAVLDWITWHEIRPNNVLSHMKEALEHQIELGHIAREPSDPLAHMMFGALTEVGLIIAHSDKKRSARKVMGAAALRQFNRLRVRAGGGKDA